MVAQAGGGRTVPRSGRTARRSPDRRTRHPEQGQQTVEFGDRQLFSFVVRPEDGWTVNLEGELRVSATHTENYRTAFSSPEVGLQRWCANLEPETRSLPELTFSQWARYSNRCVRSDLEQTVYLGLDPGDAPVRVDFTKVIPGRSAGAPGFQWKDTGITAVLQVWLSYVDVNEEAFAQRMLFLSGIFAGLAAACAPFAVQPLFAYTAAFRHYRRQRTTLRKTPRPTTGRRASTRFSADPRPAGLVTVRPRPARPTGPTTHIPPTRPAPQDPTPPQSPARRSTLPRWTVPVVVSAVLAAAGVARWWSAFTDRRVRPGRRGQTRHPPVGERPDHHRTPTGTAPHRDPMWTP